MSIVWLLEVAALQLIALMAIMAFAWTVQRWTANSGWIDAVWTFGLGAVGVLSALGGAILPDQGGDVSARQVLVAALAAVWALRLGSHIVRRSASRGDDPRYAELIRGWGDTAPPELFVLLQKQAIVSLPLALSIYLAAHNPAPGLTATDVLALAVCAVAIAGEALADAQLRRCIENSGPGGAICATGLWRFSRHPNYFFEWLYWCAFPLIAADLSGSYPQGSLALIAPITMYWLLRYVSGVPPLEEHMVRKHGDRYRAYQLSTSAFFPWVPKS